MFENANRDADDVVIAVEEEAGSAPEQVRGGGPQAGIVDTSGRMLHCNPHSDSGTLLQIEFLCFLPSPIHSSLSAVKPNLVKMT